MNSPTYPLIMVKTVFVTLITLLYLPGLSAEQSLRINKNISLERLGESVFRVNQEREPYQANSLLIIKAKQGSILVDTPNLRDDAVALVEWMRREADSKNIIVINSHFHPDSAGTNHYFREIGARIIASKRTEALLKQNGSETLLPTEAIEVNDSQSLEFFEEKLQLIYPGPSHSPDDLVVYLPRRKLLFGSCMVKEGNSLGNLSDADIGEWRSAMNRVQAIKAEIVVPGHGHSHDPSLIQNTIRLLDEALGK